MLEAVNTIHKERIVHSDLKPANFLMVSGTLKLIDFGIAKGIEGNDTTNIVRDNQVRALFQSLVAVLGQLSAGWWIGGHDELHVARSTVPAGM